MEEVHPQNAILFDVNLCAGCRKCVSACQLKQGFAADKADAKARADAIGDLSATAYTAIRTMAHPEEEDEEIHYRMMCRHCVEPTCVSVCPVGALQKSAQGPVTYDADK